jgi:endonuclease YncB( thermonuclease family)
MTGHSRQDRSKPRNAHNTMPTWKHALLALLATTCLWAHAEIITGKVVGVTDGDTVTVLDDAKRQHKIRLSGIDAPEKSQAFGHPSPHVLNGNITP